MTERTDATPVTIVDAPVSAEAATLAATVDRLRAEVDGLRRAMRSRGVIEQAKGVLMARMSCTAEEAFDQLAQLSQHTNMKVVEVAAGLLGVAAPPTAPAARAGAGRPRADVREARAGAFPRRLPTLAALPEAAPASDATPLSSEHAARYHLAASALDTAADGDDLARLLGTEAFAGATAVAVAAVEPDGALRLVGTYGIPAQRVSQWQRIPPQTAMPLTEAVRDGRPVLIRAPRPDGTEPADADPLLPGPLACAVPLTDADGAMHGALSVSWPDQSPDHDADASAFVPAVGRLCARALLRVTARSGSAAEAVPTGGDETWFRTLLDSLLDPILLLAPVREDDGQVTDFRIDYANAATVDLAGRTGDEVLGRRMTELYPGMVMSGVFGQLLDAQRTGTVYEGDTEQFAEMVGGRLRSSTMTLRAVRFRDGVLLTWRIHDEDERRAAQLAQAQRLARLGTWQYDVATGEMAWSPEMFPIVGRDPADGPPTTEELADALDPDDLPAALAVVHEMLSEHHPQTLEFRVRRDDGRPCTVRAAAETVCDPDGEEVIALRGVLQDVTAWRRTQAALAQARDQLVAERGRTAAQHEAVTMLQRAIVDTPALGDADVVKFAAHYVPSETVAQVGGDWYDRVLLPDGRMLIAIGDVSGHGLPAAAGMTTVRHALRGMAYTGAEPAQILTWLNHMVCHQRSEYIATVICALLNPATGTLTWAQAGHLPPLHIRDGQPRVLQQPFGMVLGASADAAYASGVVDLAPGDMVLMYTDGLVEHRGADLGRGLSRLVGTVRENCAAGLDACVAHVMEHLGTPNPRDDTCLIGFQVPDA